MNEGQITIYETNKLILVRERYFDDHMIMWIQPSIFVFVIETNDIRRSMWSSLNEVMLNESIPSSLVLESIYSIHNTSWNSFTSSR